MIWSIHVDRASKEEVIVETRNQIKNQEDYVPHALFAAIERQILALHSVPPGYKISVMGSGHHDATEAEFSVRIAFSYPAKVVSVAEDGFIVHDTDDTVSNVDSASVKSDAV